MINTSTSVTPAARDEKRVSVKPPLALSLEAADMSEFADRLNRTIPELDVTACQFEDGTLVVSVRSNRLSEVVQRYIERALAALAGCKVGVQETLSGNHAAFERQPFTPMAIDSSVPFGFGGASAG